MKSENFPKDPLREVLEGIGAAWIARHQGKIPVELLRRVVRELVELKLDQAYSATAGAAGLNEYVDLGHPLELLQELGEELSAAKSATPTNKVGEQRSHRSGGRRG